MTVKTALRVVLYTRVSTDDQVDDGTGLETQEIETRRYAERLNAVVVALESDPGVSGTAYPRPGIMRALAWLERGEADAIIAYNPSRLGRKVVVGATIWERVQETRSRLFLVDMGEVTRSNESMFFMGCTFAQHQWRDLLKNLTAGRNRRAEQGQQPCRAKHPYGYHVVTHADVIRGTYPDEQIGTYQVVEEQAEHVKVIFAQYAAGASLRDVCRTLNLRGIQGPQGSTQWMPTTIRIILMNPAYKGLAAFGRKVYTTDLSRLTRGLKSTQSGRKVAEEDWIRIPCTPLVDAAVWQQCQERLAGNQHNLSGNPDYSYLLSGLLRCPKCERGMYGERKRGKVFYRCFSNRASVDKTPPACDMPYILGTKVEAAVLAMLCALAREPERVAEALRALESHKTPQSDAHDAQRLKREEAQLAARYEATARAQIDALQDGRDDGVYRSLLSEIDGRRKTVGAQLAAIREVQPGDVQEPRTQAEKLAYLAQVVEEVLTADDLPNVKKRAILSTVTRSIKPEDDGFTLTTVERIVPRSLPSGTIMARAVTDTPAAATQVKERQSTSVHGVVKVVEPSAYKLTVETPTSDTRPLQGSAETEVVQKSRPVGWPALKVGQHVRVRLRHDDTGDMVCSRITIETAKSSKAPKPLTSKPVKPVAK